MLLRCSSRAPLDHWCFGSRTQTCHHCDISHWLMKPGRFCLYHLVFFFFWDQIRWTIIIIIYWGYRGRCQQCNTDAFCEVLLLELWLALTANDADVLSWDYTFHIHNSARNVWVRLILISKTPQVMERFPIGSSHLQTRHQGLDNQGLILQDTHDGSLSAQSHKLCSIF